MKISVIGSGNVGERIGRGFKDLGNEVVFYDISDHAIETLRSAGYNATNDIDYVIEKSEISFMSLPTPLNGEGIYDLSYISDAAEKCGCALKEKEGYHVFVLKSTIIPGTTEEVLIPALEKSSGKVAGEDFGVVYNPEFLTVIESTWTDDPNFTITPEKEGRIILGVGDDERATNILKELYSPFNTPIYTTDYKTAEMTKLIANNRLPLVISFSNQIFQYCEKLKKEGINVDTDFLIDMVHKDPRIGPYGSKFGKAWGGPCFKKDTVALQAFFEIVLGDVPSLVEETIKINEKMKKHGVRE